MTTKQKYMRERRRVQALIRRYKRRGLDVLMDIPSIPKRITEASVRRLAKITPKKVQEKSQGPDFETGEVLNYGRYVAQERRLRALERRDKKIREETGAVFKYDLAREHFENIISQYPDKAEEIVKNRMKAYENQHGERALNIGIEKLIEAGDVIEPSDAYNYSLLVDMLNKLSAYLNLSVEELNELTHSIDDFTAYEEYPGEFFDWS